MLTRFAAANQLYGTATEKKTYFMHGLIETEFHRTVTG